MAFETPSGIIKDELIAQSEKLAFREFDSQLDRIDSNLTLFHIQMELAMPEAEPVQASFLNWMFNALGFPYVIVLPLAGLICFLLALILVLRGKGPMAAAGLILIVHVPLLIGVFAAIQGGIASYSVIAMSPASPKPSEIAAGISTALFAPLVGILLMVPGYATAAIGAFIRSFGTNVSQSTAGR